jgi:rod shape-determining protein MreC
MAPPSSRRPGFSRRARFGIFISYVIAIVGAGIGLLLVVTARFDPEGHTALQGLLTDITSPITRTVRAITGGTKSIGENLSDYFDAASKNADLRKEVETARAKIIEGDAAKVENERLKNLLNMIDRTNDRRVATARLVSSSGVSSRRYATFAAGAIDGVVKGQPVIGPLGLVGRVMQVNQVTSRVLLITDGNSIVPVKRASDGLAAFAIGKGDGTMDIRPLNTADNPFSPKDVFLTSGSGGIYRPGIPVAIITQKTREGAIAYPRENPGSLDFAFTEQSYVAPEVLPPETETETRRLTSEAQESGAKPKTEKKGQ